MMTSMSELWPFLRRAALRSALGLAMGAMCAVVMTAQTKAAEKVDEGALTVDRTISPSTYTPGETVVVTLSFSHTNPSAVTSLAVEETIPTDWTFQSSTVSSGSTALIQPAVGATGTLEWLWVPLPTFPATLTYTVNVPGTASGAVDFTGQAAWRAGGGENYETIDATTISDGGGASTYTVTFTAGANGSLTGDAAQDVIEGTSTSPVEAVPDAGFDFVRWTSGGTEYSTSNPLTVTNVTQDLDLTAEFAAEGATYAVEFLAAANGSITGTTPQNVAEGGDADPVTAVPDTGYHFVNWTSNGTAYSTDNPLTVNNVTEAMTLTANFDINIYDVNFVAGDNGSVSGDLDQSITHGNSTTAVTATADANYHFVHWASEGTVYSTDNPLTIPSVTESLTLTAVFEADTFTVEFVAGANGSIDGTTTQTVAFGQNASPVTAVPDTGYHFVNWTRGGTELSTDNPLTVMNVTEDMTITANFAINSYTLTFVAGENGSLTGDTEQTLDHGDDATAVTAVPDANYVFSEWTMDGTTFSTSNPLEVTNVSQDMTLTAVFAPEEHTVTFLADAGGSVEGDTEQTVDHGDDLTPVTAVPDEGFFFQGWYDGDTLISTDNPLELTNVGADATITAMFDVAFYKVIFEAGENGSVEGDLVQTIQHGEDTTAVTAVPDVPYTFLRWSDGSTENPRVVEDVTEDMTLTAIFGDPTPVAPDGVFGVFIGPEEVGEGLGLWDFTGHYETFLNGYLLEMDLIQDCKGKLSGTGLLVWDPDPLKVMIEDPWDAFVIPLEVRGRKVKGKDGVVIVSIKLKGKGACVPCTPDTKLKANIKMDLTLDEPTGQLVGVTDVKVKIGRDWDKFTEPTALDLPDDMDGTWDLMMELMNDDGKVDGTAVLELSNESAYMLLLKGRVKKEDLVKLKIKGDSNYDPDARCIKIKLEGYPLGDGTFDVEEAKVKALGMKLDYEGDDDDFIVD